LSDSLQPKSIFTEITLRYHFLLQYDRPSFRRYLWLITIYLLPLLSDSFQPNSIFP
jgi:hypothetical protein